MPPRHGDSPLGHRAFRIALGHRSKNAPRLFVEERVEQRHATSEIRLDVRRARYRERDFPDAAQIARFGSGCGFDVVLRTRKYWPVRQEKQGEANAVEPCSRLAAYDYSRKLQNDLGDWKASLLCHSERSEESQFVLKEQTPE